MGFQESGFQLVLGDSGAHHEVLNMSAHDAENMDQQEGNMAYETGSCYGYADTSPIALALCCLELLVNNYCE